MTEREGVAPELLLLHGAAGKLCAMYYRPREARPPDQAVLWVPPFAEEMNKSRRMAALLARRLSAMNYAVLELDLYGTGDSEGDFADARWDTWVADLGHAVRWLGEHGYKKLHVVALRLGALLALDLVRKASFDFGQLVLWQPVTRGDNFLTQFLRLRLAASMLDSAREKESTEDLRRELRAGRPIEVAGYLLSPELALAVDRAAWTPTSPAPAATVHWFEIVSAPDRPLPPASTRCIEACRGAGMTVSAQAILGEPFWSTIEIVVTPGLLDATTSVFAAERAHAA